MSNNDRHLETLKFDWDQHDPRCLQALTEFKQVRLKENQLGRAYVLHNAVIHKYDKVLINNEYVLTSDAIKDFTSTYDGKKLFACAGNTYPMLSKEDSNIEVISCSIRGFITNRRKADNIPFYTKEDIIANPKLTEELLRASTPSKIIIDKKQNTVKVDKKVHNMQDYIQEVFTPELIGKYNTHIKNTYKRKKELEKTIYDNIHPLMESYFKLDSTLETWSGIDVFLPRIRSFIACDKETREQYIKLANEIQAEDVSWFVDLENEVRQISNKINGLSKGFFNNIDILLAKEIDRTHHFIKHLLEHLNLTEEEFQNYISVIHKYKTQLDVFFTDKVKIFIKDKLDSESNSPYNYKQFKNFIMGKYKQCSNYDTNHILGKCRILTSKVNHVKFESFKEKEVTYRDGNTTNLVVASLKNFPINVQLCRSNSHMEITESNSVILPKLTKKFKNAELDYNNNLVYLDGKSAKISAFEVYIAENHNKSVPHKLQLVLPLTYTEPNVKTSDSNYVAVDMGEYLRTTAFCSCDESYLASDVIRDLIGATDIAKIDNLRSEFSKFLSIKFAEINNDTVHDIIDGISIQRTHMLTKSELSTSLAKTYAEYEMQNEFIRKMYFTECNLTLKDDRSRYEEGSITVFDFYKHLDANDERHNRIHYRIFGRKYTKCQGIKNDNLSKMANLIYIAINHKFPNIVNIVIGKSFNSSSLGKSKRRNKKIQLFPCAQFRNLLIKQLYKNGKKLVICSEAYTTQFCFKKYANDPEDYCWMKVENEDGEKYSGEENAHTFAARSFWYKIGLLTSDKYMSSVQLLSEYSTKTSKVACMEFHNIIRTLPKDYETWKEIASFKTATLEIVGQMEASLEE